MVKHIKGTLWLCPPHVSACSGTWPKCLHPLTLAMMMALKLEHAHTHGCSLTGILKARKHTQTHTQARGQKQGDSVSLPMLAVS